MDEEAVFVVAWYSFTELLNRPVGGWIRRRVAMKYAAGADHRVHLRLRAASQGHVLTVRRFFFRRALCDLSYRTATEVTPQLPAGGDVSLHSRRRRRRNRRSQDRGCKQR
jgi:hypothetical protein